MALNEHEPRDPRLERLYREAAGETPPAHLDAAILAAARREVGARPRSFSAALRRWHVPVSIAAVLIVSVSLVILVQEEGGERLDKVRIPPTTAPPVKPAAEPAAAPPVVADLKAEQHPAESPAPAEPAPKPFLASPPAPAQEQAATPAPLDAAVAGRVESAAQAPVERRSAAPAADTTKTRPMAGALMARPAAADRPPVWQGLENEPPEKWVPRIEELVREGRVAESDEMRAEFRRRFPDHPFGQASK